MKPINVAALKCIGSRIGAFHSMTEVHHDSRCYACAVASALPVVRTPAKQLRSFSCSFRHWVSQAELAIPRLVGTSSSADATTHRDLGPARGQAECLKYAAFRFVAISHSLSHMHGRFVDVVRLGTTGCCRRYEWGVLDPDFNAILRCQAPLRVQGPALQA